MCPGWIELDSHLAKLSGNYLAFASLGMFSSRYKIYTGVRACQIDHPFPSTTCSANTAADGRAPSLPGPLVADVTQCHLLDPFREQAWQFSAPSAIFGFLASGGLQSLAFQN